MKIKQITMLIIGLVVIALIGYDFYAIAVGGTEASISHIVIVWSYKYPIIPFGMGVLIGHFFWPIKKTKSIQIINDMIKELDKE